MFYELQSYTKINAVPTKKIADILPAIVSFIFLAIEYYFVLLALIMPPVLALPTRIMSRIGRFEGQMKAHEPHSMQFMMPYFSVSSQRFRSVKVCSI